MSGGPMPPVNAARRAESFLRTVSRPPYAFVLAHGCTDQRRHAWLTYGSKIRDLGNCDSGPYDRTRTVVLDVEPHVHHVSVGEHVVLPLDLE